MQTADHATLPYSKKWVQSPAAAASGACGKELFLVVDHYLPSFANKNLGLFAKLMAEHGVAARFVSNATELNRDVTFATPGIRLVRLGGLPDRAAATMHAWRYYRYLFTHRRSIGYVWLYRGRPYVVWTALFAKVIGAKVILKLDSAGGTTRLTRQLARFKGGEPTAVHGHAIPAPARSGVDADIEENVISSRPTPVWFLRALRALPSRLRGFMLRDAALFLADVILCETPALVHELTAVGCGSRCVLWPNSLPTVQLAGYRRDAERKKEIISIGRVFNAKGFHTLIDAFARVEASDRQGWVLRIIGPTDDPPYLKKLQALAEQKHVAESVRFEPALYDDDLYRTYTAAEIFAIAHVSGVGGQSNVICEAMHFSCAIVSTDVGTIRYQLDDGNCGLLVPPDDAEALSAALRRLLTDTRLSRSLGAAAAKRAALLFSLERNAGAVLARLGIVAGAPSN